MVAANAIPVDLELLGLKDSMTELRARTFSKGQAWFDRVIFLAAGYWPPGSIRDLALHEPVEMTFERLTCSNRSRRFSLGARRISDAPI